MKPANTVVLSSTLLGVDAIPVAIEVDLGGGLPSFTLVGLAEATVREARVRVQAAMENCGADFPVARLTLNLAPAHLKKEGTGFDLPMALGILAASGAVPAGALDGVLSLGELSLRGEVRPVRGALAAAEAARDAGCRVVLVARENGPEAALVDGVEVRTVTSLADAIAFARGDRARALVVPRSAATRATLVAPDLADVRGQSTVRRAAEAAAIGSHNMLLIGGPGSGKTMIARRLPGILPPLSRAHALEVTRVHSVAGLNIGGGLVAARPFRAPHHSTSAAGLAGGGSAIPRPGEVSLAHHGVLFLDELPEFPRQTLEVLREPLESGEVQLARAGGSIRYPAQCLLVASMNPCPCGHHGDLARRCRCSAADVARYQGRVSGPLLDRIDLHVTVPPVDLAALESVEPGESSASVAARVATTQARAIARQGTTNARMSNQDLIAFARPTAAGRELLARKVRESGISARGYDKVLRVARTLADMQGSDVVDFEHVQEALQYRAQFDGSLAHAGLAVTA